MANRTHDHELLIGSTTYRFDIVRGDDNRADYNVVEDIPSYQPTLSYEQTDWIDGIGQFLLEYPDMYFEGQSIDTTQKGRVILGPLITEVYESDDTELDSAPVCFLWSSGLSKWFCATSGKIYVYGTKWTAATTVVAGVTQLAEYNGYLFAACGASTAYKYSADGDTWTTCTLIDPNATRFFAAPNPAGTTTVLWKAKSNELTYTDSGINGGTEWSSPAYIGDTSTDITNLFVANDYLMAGKADNLIHYDTDGGSHPLMNDLRTAVSTKNFQYLTTWQSSVYFSKGNGIGELSAYNTFAPINPYGDTEDIGKTGTCVGLAADENYLYAAMDEGTNTHIYKGRETRTTRGLVWQWCPWVYLGTNACATIAFCQHSSTDRRLWFGYGTHTAYVILTDNPTTDTAARFAASGWLRMCYTYGSSQYWDKLFTRLLTDTKGCSATKTVTIKYRKDTDTTATDAAAAIVTNGVVETDFTSLVACKKIQFEIHLATNASTATPEVLMIKATGVEKPESTRIHEVTYIAGDEPSRRVSTIRTALRAARSSVALIRLADLRHGETVASGYKYVICQPGYPQEVEVTHTDGRQPELGIKMRFQEVDETIVDDWGYYYGAIEDIFQDVYDEANTALGFVAV